VTPLVVQPAEPGGPAWRQATFYPFAMASRHGRGRGLAVHPESTVIRTAGYGEVPALHAAAVIDDATGAVTVFAVNRSRQAPLELRIGLRGITSAHVVEHSAIADRDEDARNTAQHPDRVRPVAVSGTRISGGTAHAVLPPMSWNMIRFE
jgi:alpha-N-arabinofuranosidase